MSLYFIDFFKSPVYKNWYCYNDSIVSQCGDPRYQNNNELEGLPYVLFYQKCNSNNGAFESQNNNYNYINLNSANNESFQESIKLYFTCNDKELYLTVEKNKINYQYLVNKLKEKYDLIQNNIQLLILNNNNNYINLYEYLKSYKLKDGDKILLIAN